MQFLLRVETDNMAKKHIQYSLHVRNQHNCGYRNPRQGSREALSNALMSRVMSGLCLLHQQSFFIFELPVRLKGLQVTNWCVQYHCNIPFSYTNLPFWKLPDHELF
jgi:hypothetical protein